MEIARQYCLPCRVVLPWAIVLVVLGRIACKHARLLFDVMAESLTPLALRNNPTCFV